MRLRSILFLLCIFVLIAGVWLIPTYAQKPVSGKTSVPSANLARRVELVMNHFELGRKQTETHVAKVEPQGKHQADMKQSIPFSSTAVGFAITPPVRNIRPAMKPDTGAIHEMEAEEFEPKRLRLSKDRDPVVMNKIPADIAPHTPTASFEGISNIDNANVFGFRVFPPDTNGDVGPTQYVQTVNLLVRVFDKTGSPLTAAFPMSSLFSSLPTSPCASSDDGDPIVLYDQLADRWMLSQFATSGPPFHQCIAISVNGDASGSYYAFDFLTPNTKFNDYPKFGVWPDAYYYTDRQFDPGFVGMGAWAFDRTKMLAGDPTATYIYFDVATIDPNLHGMMPADLDGLTQPAAGAPGIFMVSTADEFGDPADALRIFEFHADFGTPANSTFTENADSPLAVAAFDPTFNEGAEPIPPGCDVNTFTFRDDIPQPPPADLCQQVDAIADRLLHRLEYRNFGTHESFVVNQTVDITATEPDHQAGIRIYEIRRTGGTFSVNKEITYAPADSVNRWMGSVAVDAGGNLNLGFSVSNLTTFPEIRQASFDSAGNLIGESTLKTGGGSQTNVGSRWGDYSNMAVDPVDECTFWYTQEYYVTSNEVCPTLPSTACWHTWIASFPISLGSCAAPSTGTLTGTVTNAATSAPIEGARVIATNNANSAVYEAATDVNGVYSRLLPPGDYTLVAKAINYIDSAPVVVTITAGQTTTQDFQLTGVPSLALNTVTIDDSGGNNNGVIDPNECVNLTINLKNNGAGPATGINSTLVSNTTGVTVVQGTSTYPDIPPGGSAPNDTPFQISVSATFVCGDTISLTLNVTSNEGPFTIDITLPTGSLSSATSFSATGPVPIPDNDGTVSLPIVVSGMTGTVGKIVVTAHLTHTWDGDLNIGLTGPNATTINLSDDNGGSGDNYGTDCPNDDGDDTIFDDAAATPITGGSAPFVGTFSPEEALAAFNGIDPNGTWSLNASDDAAVDTGNIECWQIDIQTVSCTDGGGTCGGGACAYSDDFNDGVLTWVVVKPTVVEANGFLSLTPAGRKAIATSDPVFAGCSTCTITTNMQFTGGVGSKSWLLTHRIDKNNQIEIIFKQDRGKVVVREKFGGTVLKKVKANFAFAPNTNYQMQASYDGTTYTLKIDGVTIITMTPTGPLPVGVLGYQSKNETTNVDDVCVN